MPPPNTRRRPAVQITLGRAARLHRLVTILVGRNQTRGELLAQLGIGLRTFYRELELLRSCGVKVRLVKKQYALLTTAEEAEGSLPFPDPQLSFAEMAELAQGAGKAALRLRDLLASVVMPPEPSATTRRKKAGDRPKAGGDRPKKAPKS